MMMTLTISSPLIWRNRPRMSKTLSGWDFQFRRARRSTENTIKANSITFVNVTNFVKSKKSMWCKITILCEFGGAEYRGDPEGFFGAPLEGQVGRQVGATVEVFFTAGQAQVQALVTKGGIFITLKGREKLYLDSETFFMLKRASLLLEKMLAC